MGDATEFLVGMFFGIGIALLSFVLTQNKDNPEFQSMRKSLAGFLVRFADSIEES